MIFKGYPGRTQAEVIHPVGGNRILPGPREPALNKITDPIWTGIQVSRYTGIQVYRYTGIQVDCQLVI